MLRFIEIHSPRLRPEELETILEVISKQGDKIYTLGTVSRQIPGVSPSRVVAGVAHLIFRGELLADIRETTFDGALVIKASNVVPESLAPRLTYFG